MISADVKANVKQQEIKPLIADILNTFLYKVGLPSKRELQCKKGLDFSFNFGWYSIQLDIVH